MARPPATSSVTPVETVLESEHVSIPHPKRRHTLMLIGGAAVLVLIVVESLWSSGLLPFGRHGAVATAGPVYVDVPEIITNLDVPSGQDSYAKLKATLELSAGSSPEAIMKDMPRVIDMFQTYLRAMRPSELRGASGTYRLREALINRVRIAVAPNVVQDILFQELIVQ